MKVFIKNPTDFLRREMRDLKDCFSLAENYSEYCDGTILLKGDMRIDTSFFNNSEKIKITYYHESVERFTFYLIKPEFTELEIRL